MPLFPALLRPPAHPAIWLAQCLLLAAPLASANTAVPAQDVAMLAGTCFNCHGPGGKASGAIPGLQSQSAERLLQRMQDFKAGKAADATVMGRLMKGYDDAQIRALADWFARKGAQ